MKVSIKESIRIAVLKLMEEKPYLEITVTDIVDKADISRASFYRSYRSIDDVVDDIVDKMANKINTVIIPSFQGKDKDGFKNLLTFILTLIRNNEVVGLKLRKDNSDVFLYKMKKIYSGRTSKEGITTEEKYKNYVNIAIILASIALWIQTDYQESVEEMASYIVKTINY